MMHPDIRKAVDTLYKVLSIYESNKRTHGFNDDDLNTVDPLFSKALRELSSNDLEQLQQRAMTTLGNKSDFKHFLPRLIELHLLAPDSPYMISDALFGTCTYSGDLPILGEKLAMANWLIWPKEEVKAIRSVLRREWERRIEAEPSEPVRSWFQFIAESRDDLQPYFEGWDRRLDDNYMARVNLAYFLSDSLKAISRGRGGPFWSKPLPEQKEATRTWLLRYRILKVIERSRHEWQHLEFANGFEFELQAFKNMVESQSRE